MAEETKNVSEQEMPKVVTEESSSAEVTDRALFDFLGKKKDETKPEESTIDSEFAQKVHISEPAPDVKHMEEEEKKPSLLEKLHRSDSSSSSSSEEEGEDGETSQASFPPLKAHYDRPNSFKLKDSPPALLSIPHQSSPSLTSAKPIISGPSLPGQNKKPEDASAVAAAPVVVPPPVDEAHPVEKKGCMDKLKEKLPGHTKKPEDASAVAAAPVVPPPVEKKGILEKIMGELISSLLIGCCTQLFCYDDE